MFGFSKNSSSKLLSAITLTLGALLVGCASKPQLPVALEQQNLIKPNVRVGVAMVPVPEVNTHFPGAGCLLCIAAAELNHTSLTSHVKTLPTTDVSAIKSQVAALLKKKGATVVVLNEPLKLDSLPDFGGSEANASRKDFRSLAARHQIDKLVVIEVGMLGILREYSAYFPTSDPKAIVSGGAFVVNLNNNVYEWFMPLDVRKAAEGPWDEGPKFPGLTNAYYQSIEEAKDRLTAPLR